MVDNEHKLRPWQETFDLPESFNMVSLANEGRNTRKNMSTLADMEFKQLQAGMKFRHPLHGEQVILDLGRNRLGPVIQFHNSPVYGGKPDQLASEDEELNIFEAIAQNTFPAGAEDWEYLGLVEVDEIESNGWDWLAIPCPHCGFIHKRLTTDEPLEHKRCRECGWHPSALS